MSTTEHRAQAGAFTPGPWTYSIRAGWHTISGGGFKGIAEAWQRADDGAFIPDDQALANAHLIAAAPDMFGAVSALASIPIGPEIADDRDMILYRNGTGSITVGDVLYAKAALTKALGKSPDAVLMGEGGVE